MTIIIDYDNLPPDGPVVAAPLEIDDACSILVPVDATAAGVVSSITAAYFELAEDPRPTWDATVTYAAGDQIYLLGTHRVYESAADGNTGKDPSLPTSQYNAAGVATWWIDIGPTNRYAMFDSLVSSQTSAASPLSITLTPGAFNGFALFGVDADSYSVTVKDSPGGNVIYSELTTPLEASQPADYYEYFFDRFKPLRQLIRAGIEPYGDAEITLTLNRATGSVGLGMFAIGDLRPVGIPQRDATVEPQDFSYFKQDAFGNATVKKRANATGMSISTVMDKADANSVLDTIKEVLGTPVVVVGSQASQFEWLTVFGLISGSMSPVPYPYATLKITVKGFI
jgi:hypothetical protein